MATQGGGIATGRGLGRWDGNKDKWQLEAFWRATAANVLAVLGCPLVPLLQLGAIAEAVRRHAPGECLHGGREQRDGSRRGRRELVPTNCHRTRAVQQNMVGFG